MTMKLVIYKKGKDNKNALASMLISIAMVFISATGYLRYYILPNDFARGLVSIVLLGILLIYVISGKKTDYKLLINVLLMMIIFLINNAYIQHKNWIFVISFLAMFFLCIMAETTINWSESYFDIVFVIYIFYGICTIAFYFMPSFYMNNVVDLFPETRNRLISWYKSGCMAGLTEHYSTNGTFLAAGTIMATAKLFANRLKKKKDWFLFFFFVIALLLTGKRGHVLFTAAAIYALYYFYLGNKKMKLLKMLVTAFAVICFALIVFTLIPELGIVLVRLKEYVNEGAFAGRGSLWLLAIELFKSHPLFGIGWGEFRYHTFGLIRWAESAHTHNTYLQLLAETGSIGFLVYIVWMGRIFWWTVQEFSIARENSWEKKSLFYLEFSLCYQVFFLLYCITGNPLYDYETFVPYFVSCAISIYYQRKIKYA